MLFSLTFHASFIPPGIKLNDRPKKNYKVYYKNLEYYLKLGIKVTKVHKILTFDEKPFLKEYIDLNTNLRKYAKK